MSVTPELPTVLSDQEALQFPDGNELFLQLQLNICHVVPSDIITDKFQSALSKTLANFPHAAGRLKHDEQGWKASIVLTNSPVSIEIVDEHDRDEVLSSNLRGSVLQKSEDLLPFITPVSLEGAVTGQDVPLITFKLTKLSKTGETVIGISWNHILGDATTLKLFMTTLSQYYQDLAPPDAPTFHKRSWPQPPQGPEGDELYKQYAPHVVKSYPMADVIAKYTAEAMSACMVDLTFTKEQQDRLLVLAQASSPRLKEKQRQSVSSDLTRQDALSAHLISLQRRCYNSPVRSVMYMMNYRTQTEDTNALWRHPKNAGNCVYLPSFDISSSDTLPDLARAIRQGVNNARTTEFLETYLTLNGAAQEGALRTGQFHIYPAEDVVLINGLAKDNIGRAAHFGFEGKSQYYTDVSWERMFRIFPVNPVKKEDGTWESNEGSTVVAFRVKNELKDRLFELFEEDMKRIMNGSDIGADKTTVPTTKTKRGTVVNKMLYVLRVLRSLKL
ncbi:hypothetical protein QCA50_001593 [Cerrena zonata]|uniref:Uncharacterized protein n=1 Tax=Cerrena zonata TaxID=2478898 RepID=A0AAW0GW68_9APHY